MEKPLTFSVLVLEDCRSGVTITINISNFSFFGLLEMESDMVICVIERQGLVPWAQV